MTDKPKRFYKDVSLTPYEDGWAIALDGKPAKTNGRLTLAAGATLAEAIRQEWQSQEDVIDLASMPLTKIHGFVLDSEPSGRETFVQTIVQYASSDLLCYRADDAAIAQRQQTAFSPFLSKAEADGYTFLVTTGLLPIEQPPATLERLRKVCLAWPMYELFSRKLLTEICGSAILALYADKNPDEAFRAARLDEHIQAETWGVDAEAEARERQLRQDFDAVLHYLTLAKAHQPNAS